MNELKKFDESACKNEIMEIFQREGIYCIDAKEELMLDSLQFVSLIADLEDYYAIRIAEEFFRQDVLKTLADFVKMIELHLR